MTDLKSQRKDLSQAGLEHDQWPYRLLAPGPVPVPRAVTEAMSGPLLHHRTPQFERILREAWEGLKYMFATKQPVMILTGSGTAAMEAAVINTLSPGDEALVVVSGKFGERFAEICVRFGIKTHRLNVEWGKPVVLTEFESRLKEHKNLKAVFSQACETSTATVHPIQEMSRLVRQHLPSALFVVDGITAIGCMPLPMDEWELDVVVGGSQKAFMLPPGLSFIALSERAWQAQKNSRSPKFYLDLAGELKANNKNETHFTIPTPLVTGLHTVVAQVQKVGLDRVIERCAALAGATRRAGESLGLKVYSQAPSPSVTALLVTDSGKARDWLERERNITLMGGQDGLKGKILRIGHMGDVHDSDMVATFTALTEYLQLPPQKFDKADFLNQLKTTKALFG